MTTGELIKERRTELGLSQRELGERLGVTGSMIGQYENGTRTPKFQTLCKIAAALETQVANLYGKDVSFEDGLKILAKTAEDGRKAEAELLMAGDDRQVVGELLMAGGEQHRFSVLSEVFSRLNSEGQRAAIAAIEGIAAHPHYQKMQKGEAEKNG